MGWVFRIKTFSIEIEASNIGKNGLARPGPLNLKIRAVMARLNWSSLRFTTLPPITRRSEKLLWFLQWTFCGPKVRAPSCYQMVTIDECKYIKATQQRSYKKKIKFISLGKLNLLYFFHNHNQYNPFWNYRISRQLCSWKNWATGILGLTLDLIVKICYKENLLWTVFHLII